MRDPDDSVKAGAEAESAVDPDPLLPEAVADPPPDPDPPPTPARKPKLPTAVTFVIVLGTLTALVFLARGGFLAWVLWRCGALETNLRPLICGQPPSLIDPREYLVDALHGIGVALAMAVILVGFRRLRTWAWVALMTWGGYVLARDLLWYYLYPAERSGRYLGMLLSALIVLALNQEDVQKAFGLQRDAHDPARIPSGAHPPERV